MGGNGVLRDYEVVVPASYKTCLSSTTCWPTWSRTTASTPNASSRQVFLGGCDQVTALACCRGNRIRGVAAASCSDEFADPKNASTYQNLISDFSSWNGELGFGGGEGVVGGGAASFPNDMGASAATSTMNCGLMR
jgi:hypothetical protein